MRRNSFCYNLWIKQLHYNRVPSYFLFTYHKCIILLQSTMIFTFIEDTFYFHFRLIEKANTQD